MIPRCCEVDHDGRMDAHIWIMRPTIVTVGLTLLLSGGLLFAQGAKDDMKKAGQDVKSAGKSVGSATKKTAKTAKRKVKHKTNRAAAKVEDKTRDKQ